MIRKPTIVFFLIAVSALSAAVLMDFPPVFPRRNVSPMKHGPRELAGAVNRPGSVAASPTDQSIAKYGKLPLGFETNAGRRMGASSSSRAGDRAPRFAVDGAPRTSR